MVRSSLLGVRVQSANGGLYSWLGVGQPLFLPKRVCGRTSPTTGWEPTPERSPVIPPSGAHFLDAAAHFFFLFCFQGAVAQRRFRCDLLRPPLVPRRLHPAFLLFFSTARRRWRAFAQAPVRPRGVVTHNAVGGQYGPCRDCVNKWGGKGFTWIILCQNVATWERAAGLRTCFVHRGSAAPPTIPHEKCTQQAT